MTNRERITSNNALIDEAIEIANALPDAGGGGTVEPIIEQLEVTKNGTYSAPSGIDGYNPVTVNVPIPDGYIKPSGTKSITSNGTHDVASYSSVNVGVPTEGGIEIPSSSAATATDIASGKQAEVNGTLVTGSVQTMTGQYNTTASSVAAAGGKLYLDKTFTSPMLFRKNAYIELTTNLSNLGDASAADVVAGKTFTSTAGKKVTGTHVCSGGDISGWIDGTIEEVVDSTAESVRNYAFAYKNIWKADLCVTRINENAFSYSDLEVLILRSTSVVTLSNTNAFDGLYDTLWEEGEDYWGTVYVPRSLISNYRTATNWSNLFMYGWDIQAIEGSEYE